MSDDPNQGTLKEHEKFWAFIVLIAVVSSLVLVAAFALDSGSHNPATDVVYAAKLRIIDAAVAGLLTITGMAAQALFRVSSTDKLAAETALTAAQKLPEPAAPAPLADQEPLPVKVMNPPDDPANVTDAHGETDAGLPEGLR